MSYVVRVVQGYLFKDRDAFMALEARFAAMEQERSDFPKGRRLQPCIGGPPSNTLIWESEFPTMAEAQATIALFSSDPVHEKLFSQQAPYIVHSSVEIYEVLEFSKGTV